MCVKKYGRQQCACVFVLCSYVKTNNRTVLLAKKVLEGVPCAFPHSGYGLGSHCIVCVRSVQV
jgi:hypothetical protein